jgi:hypothetical protein
MATTTLRTGTQVKRVVGELTGIVVPDTMNMCPSGFVMVDFDGQDGVKSCAISDLRGLGIVTIRFNAEKCKGCIFGNSEFCHRYDGGRFGWALASKGDKRTPRRMYPFCQDEPR